MYLATPLAAPAHEPPTPEAATAATHAGGGGGGIETTRANCGDSWGEHEHQAGASARGGGGQQTGDLIRSLVTLLRSSVLASERGWGAGRDRDSSSGTSMAASGWASPSGGSTNGRDVSRDAPRSAEGAQREERGMHDSWRETPCTDQLRHASLESKMVGMLRPPAVCCVGCAQCACLMHDDVSCLVYDVSCMMMFDV
jgi:hypothetical protein